jgi:uncharacterized membrane protein YbhN (UPF0104 family)
MGAAFALVAPQVEAPIVQVVSAWGAAWTVGFLAFVFPAGLGIREGVLVAAIGWSTPAAVIVSASVVHRLVTMVAEVCVAALSHARRVPRPRTEVDSGSA